MGSLTDEEMPYLGARATPPRPTDKTFWILWQPEYHAPPKVRFATYAEALRPSTWQSV